MAEPSQLPPGDPDLPRSPKPTMAHHRLLPALLGGLGVFLVAVFVARFFQPEPFEPQPPPERGYPSEPMVRALDFRRVEERQQAILELGSRFMGQEGHRKAEDHVRQSFLQAGLELFEVNLRTAGMVTHQRRIESVPPSPAIPARPLPGVEIYPFFPNHLQPGVTPPEGLEGELVLLDPETLASREDFRDVIGLIDCSAGSFSPEYGFMWMRYAKLGIKALVVSHPDGFESMPWLAINDRYSGIVSSVPVNFVRVAATPEVFRHVGQRVRLHLTTRWEQVPVTTLIGVARAAFPTEEAIVVPFNYDAVSVLPDKAPGALPAVQMAGVLQFLEGLQHYRSSLRRDIVFVAFGNGFMAEDGLNNLLRVLLQNRQRAARNPLLHALGLSSRADRPESEEGGDGTVNRRLLAIAGDKARDVRHLALVEAILPLLERPGFMRDADSTLSALRTLRAEEEAFFREQFAFVLDTLVFELNEPFLQARIAYERTQETRTDIPEFASYLAAKRVYDAAASAAGYPPELMIRRRAEMMDRYDIGGRLRQRFQLLFEFHHERMRQHAQEEAVVGLFDGYRNFSVFEWRLVPDLRGRGREVIGLHNPNLGMGAATLQMQRLVRSAVDRLGFESRVEVDTITANQASKVESSSNPMPMQAFSMWSNWGYAVHGLINFGRRGSYAAYVVPFASDQMKSLRTIQYSLAVAGETLLAFAHGTGTLYPAPVAEHLNRTFGGQVLVSNVGQSIVPSYPLVGALIANRSFVREGMYNFPGYYIHNFVLTDPYGRYRLRNNASDFPVNWRVSFEGNSHTPIAAGFDAHGFISHMKDEGEDGQRLFKSINVPLGSSSRVSIVTFRASPVAVFDLTNPQTMRDYTGLQHITQTGLARFRKICHFEDIGVMVSFLEPDKRFFALFQSGAADNDLVTETRAFALNVRGSTRLTGQSEIEGDGYLVADFPVLLDVPVEIASSMTLVNGHRLDLQNRYGMADGRTNSNHRLAVSFLEASEQHRGAGFLDSLNQAREAVTFQTLNHPVLRRSVFEAVLGIIWYLALLVPFVFFFEKLVFCFPDVRKQIAAQSVIFLTVFILLRILHPAFEMVRSSLMILLGFIIILISGGITVLFSSKFRENLEELRKKQGKVTAAEVNTLGVMGSAFMLGLNNMHRRKVRTGLTCATLSLLTFVMICFTSVRNDLVEETVAVGRAPYQGMLIKKDLFGRVSPAEVFAFNEKFGRRFQICERVMYIGRPGTVGNASNPGLIASAERDGLERIVEFDSILEFDHREPLAGQIRMLTSKPWFTVGDQTGSGGRIPVFLPDRMAERLGILADDVESGEVLVTINSVRFRVAGIFEAESLDNLRDLDGEDLMPFDVEAMGTIVTRGAEGVIAQDDDPRIRAERVVIAPVRDLGISIATSMRIIRSLAVVMPDAGYREASEVIDGYMIQTAQPLYYGLDGIAYRGQRTRQVTLAGLIDLIIPLLIAALTVLNTMKGSVYERRSEIYVYNAVGIAPRYIFFMFFAEAFVYAVVGSVLGYLLSQGTGRVLTELGLTGGLNMTFTSLATIYASLTIVAAVFISTIFPARSAMEIAAPSEDSGWDLPEPEGDLLAFDLPFNFRPRGRVAVLAFFNRYLLDHGEGGAGHFFSGQPVPGVLDSATKGEYVPFLAAPIWLKPFDLGVSQRLIIQTPHDPQTGLFKARIEIHRLSGTRESWVRLNKGFVALLRRHFLHWRAVSEPERDEMFNEAQSLIQDHLSPPLSNSRT